MRGWWGTKRHHHHPYHWVKTGKTAGYVPIHPRDVAGKPPLNLKNGLLRPDKGGAVERIAYEDGQKVKLLDEAPKAFRNEGLPALERAEEPRAVAYRLADRAGQDHVGQSIDGASKIALARPVGVPVTFDHKSQSFMVAQTVEHGGAMKTVVEPIGGRGNNSVQTHSGGGEFARGGGGGYSGGASASRGSSYSGRLIGRRWGQSRECFVRFELFFVRVFKQQCVFGVGLVGRRWRQTLKLR